MNTEIDSNLIVRRVNIPKVVNGNEVEEVEVFFFKPDCMIECDKLRMEYQSRELKPADSVLLEVINNTDPSFAQKYPHVTSGDFEIAIFHTRDDNRKYLVDSGKRTFVSRCVIWLWNNHFWFAGVKSNSKKV